MTILHVNAEFLTEFIPEAARIEVADLCALAFVPKVLIVIGETEIRVRILNELDGDISATDFAFPALEAAVATALALSLGVLLSDTVSDR